MLFLAGAATTAGNVERYRNQITFLERFDILADLDHFAGDFVTQHQPRSSSGAAAHHVLIGAANIGRGHFQDHAMFNFLAGGIIQLGEGNGLDFDPPLCDVNDTAIFCHDLISFVVGWCWMVSDEPPAGISRCSGYWHERASGYRPRRAIVFRSC